MSVALSFELGRGAEAPAAPPADYPHRRPLLLRGRLRRLRLAPPAARSAEGGGETVEVLVRPGQRLEPGDAVLRYALAGRAAALAVAGPLGLPPERAASAVMRSVGDMIADGDVVAERRTLAGLQRRQVRSPVTGRVVRVSSETGTVYVQPLPVEGRVLAHLAGTVSEVRNETVVMEGTALAITGMAGAGPAAAGGLVVADVPGDLPDQLAGAIVACGFSLSEPFVQRLVAAGAAGVLAAGMEEAAMARLGWDDLLWPHPGRPTPTPPLTIVLLDSGPATPPPGLWDALRPYTGRQASLLGSQAGGAAELVVPVSDGDAGAEQPVDVEPGQRVRIVAGRAGGLTGEVAGLSAGLHRLSSEVMAEAADIAFPHDVHLRLPLLHLRQLNA